MKLCVVIIHNRDKNRVTDELVRAGFKFTIIGSTGGFLREGNTTFLIGTEESEVDVLRQVLKDHCQAREQVINFGSMEAGTQGAFVPSPIKVPVGGAVMFVMPVDQFERF
ncbi:MAG: cyclic-di-AMP receptor [Armatimonadetes bacterium]|nr:cyclic-di-AMP receptor [Armatimonadota bacterium]